MLATTENTNGPASSFSDVYLTSKEAAKYRRLAEVTLRHERAEGRGPAYVKHGRRILYRRADIDAYLTAHMVEPGKGKARPDA